MLPRRFCERGLNEEVSNKGPFYHPHFLEDNPASFELFEKLFGGDGANGRAGEVLRIAHVREGLARLVTNASRFRKLPETFGQ